MERKIDDENLGSYVASSRKTLKHDKYLGKKSPPPPSCDNTFLIPHMNSHE
jgi:hypothetical protein